MQDNGRIPQPTPIMDRKNHTRLQAAQAATLPFALCSMIQNNAHGNKPERLVRERTPLEGRCTNRLATIFDVYLVAIQHYVSIRVAKRPLQAESMQPSRSK